MRCLTSSVNIRVLAETVLHALELFHTIDSLGFLFAVDKARECFTEVFTARTMGHATEARAIPVDLSGLLVESRLTFLGLSLVGLFLNGIETSGLFGLAGFRVNLGRASLLVVFVPRCHTRGDLLLGSDVVSFRSRGGVVDW